MKTPARWLGESIADEFADAQLGDRRRTVRLQQVAEALARRPSVGFPQVFPAEADLEAFYRLLRNEAVQLDNVVEPHLEATAQRAEEYGACLVLHDTTTFKFGGATRREGLGHTASKAQGFLAHVALAVGLDEVPTPLGVLGVDTLVRKGSKGGRKRKTKAVPPKESQRWTRMVEAVQGRAAERFECIHVMDREADFIGLLRCLEQVEARYVIRAARNRSVTDTEYANLAELVADLKPRARRTARIAPRGEGLNPTMSATHPPREGREVKLGIAGISVNLRASDRGEPFATNIVRVWELNPPRGEEPIDWLLMTSEPISTAEELAAVVDYYRARWMIEEYFKSLKSGCIFEKRQLESLHTLTVALGAFIPIAWRLLLVRAVARGAPKRKANTFLRGPELFLVARRAGVSPQRLTAAQACAEIARMGGHLKNNGEPGWLVLSRGYQDLLLLARGWTEAMAAVQAEPIGH
jgi:hypothetical protein